MLANNTQGLVARDDLFVMLQLHEKVQNRGAQHRVYVRYTNQGAQVTHNTGYARSGYTKRRTVKGVGLE